MKSILAAVCILAVASAHAAMPAPPPAADAGRSSVFADLTDLGFDLGKFRPDFAGRFPYR